VKKGGLEEESKGGREGGRKGGKEGEREGGRPTSKVVKLDIRSRP
jgi:hypothetical protein